MTNLPANARPATEAEIISEFRASRDKAFLGRDGHIRVLDRRSGAWEKHGRVDQYGWVKCQVTGEDSIHQFWRKVGA